MRQSDGRCPHDTRMTERELSGRNRPLRGLIVAPFGVSFPREGSRVHVAAHMAQLESMGHDLWYLGLGLGWKDTEGMAEKFGDRYAGIPLTVGLRLWRRIQRMWVERFQPQPPVDFWYRPEWTVVARELQERVRFDYVLVHYIFYSRVFEAFPKEVRRILDTHDSFADRVWRLASKGVRNRWRSCSKEDEIMALSRAHYVMANQPEEAKIFEACVKSRVVTVGHPSSWQPEPEPDGLRVGFLAAENPMNVAGLSWFFERCWPRIREAVPEAVFLLAGRICTISGPWETASGVTLLGTVETVGDFHRQATVEINPVSAGSGLKIKTMETLGHGRPLVSTTEGVSGLDRGQGAFVVEDEPEAFADAVIRLLRTPAERESLRSGAHRLIGAWNLRQGAALESLFEGLEPEKEHS
jgi:hypothetical protein